MHIIHLPERLLGCSQTIIGEKSNILKINIYLFYSPDICVVESKNGAQALQKRKNWEVRTWELVGTQIPRWHLAATSR